MNNLSRPNRSRTPLPLASVLGLAASILAAFAPAAEARVENVSLYFRNHYTQTGPIATANNYLNFEAQILEFSPSDVTSATLTYPGSSSPGTYAATIYRFDNIAPGDIQIVLPFGTYTTNFIGPTGNGSVNINYTRNAAPNVPLLTAATYNTLTAPTGLDSTKDLNIVFNNFQPDPSALSNYIFVSITDETGTYYTYNQGFLPITATSAFVPAGTLMPDTNYSLQVYFTDRLPSRDNGIDTDLFFVQGTTLNFTTAAVPVPEGSTLASFGLLIVLGMNRLALASRKRRQM